MVEAESMDLGFYDDGILDWESFESFSNPISDIEQFLMDDNSGVEDPSISDPINAFLSDILLDSPLHSSQGDSGTPSEIDHESPLQSSQANTATHSSCDDEKKTDHVPDKDDDDPLAKKRKRQLRNRDAAVKSRERKKEYVRDLEMKSKYFEAECRRLGMVLQCCVAENHALRLSLQNNMAVDASGARQESAVLVMESLLLGSLLWFLGITCLLLLPSQLHATPKEIPLGNGESGSQLDLFPRKGSSKFLRKRLPLSFMLSKSCRASRSRMKLEVTAQFLRCLS